MKEIKLNGTDKVALIDDEDYDKVTRYKWRVHYNKEDPENIPYAVSTTKPEIKMHRLILGLEKGDPRVVDHKDYNGINNQRNNIRICTRAENARNQRAKKNSISNFKGVTFNKSGRGNRRWRCRITLNYKRISLGRYGTELEAAWIYNQAAKKFHGEFACLNAIPESFTPKDKSILSLIEELKNITDISDFVGFGSF